MVDKLITDSIVLEGNFNRYIFEAKDSFYFIASIILKPYAMDNLRKYILDKNGKIEVNALSIKNDIPLLGASEHFKNEVKDKFSEYSFEVSVSFDEKYQRYNLHLLSFIEKMPTTEEAMVHFLAKKIKTIGKITAKKIVKHFGHQNIEYILNNEIKRLKELPFIKESQLDQIEKSWLENKMVFEVMNYLKEFDVSDSIGLKIYNKYNRKSLEIIKTNPYNLCLIEGITFKLADKIALSNGINKEDPKRIMYGINYIMDSLMNTTGSTILEKQIVINKTYELINVRKSLIEGYINALIDKNKIIVSKDNNGITTSKIYKLENNIFNLIIENVTSNSSRQLFSEKEIKNFEKENKFKLDEFQLNSVCSIFRNKINVLTGGPGTGKTTTLKSIVSAFEEKGYKVALLAPTGRAAQRMVQSTGRSAETIHRFLKIMPEEVESDYISVLNANEFIDYDLVVIDESSMLDLYVVNQLLRRINPQRTAILFVGDIDQLPPVGIGYFLRDIIQSEIINVCKLEIIHRQSENSSIATNAKNIKNRKTISLKTTEDFEFIQLNNEESTKNKIKEIYKNLIEQGVNQLDIQILSPTREKALSCKELNKIIRPIANKNFIVEQDDDKKNKRIEFVEGDKVIQKENNYDLMVFNGDVGMVVDVEPNYERMTIEFGDPNYKLDRVDYEKNNFNELDLSYCITIHKSQGSDYQYVIIPLTRKHYYQWNNRLLYTAITRAKKKVFLVGSKETLLSVNNERKNEERITNMENMFKLFDKRILNNTMDVSDVPF